MFKIIRLFKKLALKLFRADNNEFVKSASSKPYKTIVDLSNILKKNKSRNLINIKVIGKLIFLTFNVTKPFNYLKHAFIKALIFYYFNLKWYIQIKTNALDYIIYRILS